MSILTLPTRARWPKSPLGVEIREVENKLHDIVLSFTGARNVTTPCQKPGNEARLSHTNDPAELFACLQVNCGKVAGSGGSVSQGTLLHVHVLGC